MRVVFMGTPHFAAVVLEELALTHEVVAVYTRPDAVRSRGKKLEPSPVKEMARHLGFNVRTPKTLRDEDEVAYLAGLAPDAICVAAYGAILPPSVLSVPLHGCLNVHASLLPRWRGAAPIERAILAGDEEMGVCIMRMEEGLDTGDYCVRRSIPARGRYADDLADELANLGARALMTGLAHVEAGVAHWVAQDESQVTYADKLAKGELNLDPAQPAETNERRVRASGEAHKARCTIAGRNVAVQQASVFADSQAVKAAFGSATPCSGQAVYGAKRLILSCESGVLEITRLKPDGKNSMDAAAFAAGVPVLRQAGGEWGSIDG